MPITQSTILPLKYGVFRIAYHKQADEYCISISYGDLKNKIPIVRLHSSCLFSEAFQGLICDCAEQLSSTLKLIKKNESGVVVYRFMEGRGVGLETKIKTLELQRTKNINSVEAFKTLGFTPDLREYETEITALHELDINPEIRVAGQNPYKTLVLIKAGFIPIEHVHPAIKVTRHNIDELLTKQNLLGYKFKIDLLHHRKNNVSYQ